MDPLAKTTADGGLSKLERFTKRRSYPYLHGTYLGINAIADAFLLVDGPNCGFHKAEHVFGAHDWRSTLLDVSGFHRIMHTELHPNKIIGGSDARFLAVLRHMALSGVPKVIFLGSMPMASMTGTDYEGLMEQVALETDVAMINLRDRSLDRDWLDGYADFLIALAKSIEPGFPAPALDPRKVAIVGHLMHRNEEDQRGDLRELRRLVEALDLELCSVWLEGGRYEELGRAFEAGTIVSFPYGRRAAKLLSRRTGAQLVEVDLPFGPEASERFVRALAGATAREGRVEALIDAELAPIARAWEWLIPKRLQLRRLAFHGDPYLMPGVAELARLLAMEVVELIAYAQEKPGLDPSERLGAALPCPIRWQPRVGLEGSWRAGPGPAPELVIGGSDAAPFTPPEAAFVEHGYPMRGTHFAFDAPSLGFRGALAFVDRISNAVGDRIIAAS